MPLFFKHLLKLSLCMLLLMPAFFVAQDSQAAEGKKPLVAYFSRSGNTAAIADMIHKQVGGDFIQIKPVTPYPEDYNETVELAKKEQQSNARPPIETKINPDDYDVIFLGFPNWWSSMPMPVWTFVEQNGLNGKTIVPFVTHGGGGLGHTVGDLKKLCPQSKILDAFYVSGNSASSSSGKVNKWLKDLGPAIKLSNP